jgi:type II secretory pathway component PulK
MRLRSRDRHDSTALRTGMVLYAVLIVVVLLSLAAYQYSELMSQEQTAAASSLRQVQARACADSGIHAVAAWLADPDITPDMLYDNETQLGQVPVGDTGTYSIVAPFPRSEALSTRNYRFGLIDESSKINLNALLRLDTSGRVAFEMLMKLPNMTEEIADAIIDWIDPDDNPRPYGAESQTYLGGSPSYRCKNGPLDSVEELLLVRGVTPELLFGTDRNRNGIADPGEDDGNGWDPGWAAYFTIYSREMNVDSEGQSRIYLNDSDVSSQLDTLSQIFDQDLAQFIVLYRTQSTSQPMGSRQVRDARPEDIQSKIQEVLQGRNVQPRSISSRFELIEAEVYWTVGSGRQQQTVRWRSPLSDATRQRTLLPILLDKTTTQRDTELPARINVLTAPQEVLACLPGLTDADVQSIVDLRPPLGSSEAAGSNFQTTAWLFLEANLSIDKMRTLERYITTRSQVYRVQSIGSIHNSSQTARVEAVIDTNGGRPRIVMWRDLSELGRGYNLQR